MTAALIVAGVFLAVYFGHAAPAARRQHDDLMAALSHVARQQAVLIEQQKQALPLLEKLVTNGDTSSNTLHNIFLTRYK